MASYRGGCPFCVEQNSVVWLEDLYSVYKKPGRKFNIRECLGCQVLFTSPIPSNAELEEIYKQNYEYEFHSYVRQEKYLRAKSLIKHLVNEKLIGKRVIEFGSGEGQFIRAADNFGIEVTGVEQYVGQDQASTNIIKISAEEFLKNYDISGSDVYISHTFEHLIDPHSFLVDLYSKMSTHSKVVCVVPNAKLRNGSIRRRTWGYWQVPVHIAHFDLISLQNIFIKTGFQIEETTTRSRDFLSIGIEVLNIVKPEFKKRNKNSLLGVVIRMCSIVWFLTYNFGDSDLIIVASKTNQPKL